jgi:hypothetical protein
VNTRTDRARARAEAIWNAGAVFCWALYIPCFLLSLKWDTFDFFRWLLGFVMLGLLALWVGAVANYALDAFFDRREGGDA